MTSNTASDPRSASERQQEFAKRRELIRLENKTVLFDALAQVGITSVELEFDGGGERGRIEDFTAFAADSDYEVDLLETKVELARTQFGNPETTREQFVLKDAIICFTYDVLDEIADTVDFDDDFHLGWTKNVGAFGNFIFDVAARKITLNYNRRIVSSELSEHVI